MPVSNSSIKHVAAFHEAPISDKEGCLFFYTFTCTENIPLINPIKEINQSFINEQSSSSANCFVFLQQGSLCTEITSCQFKTRSFLSLHIGVQNFVPVSTDTIGFQPSFSLSFQNVLVPELRIKIMFRPV